MDVNQVFNEMTVDEITEFIHLILDFFGVDRTPLEAPPVNRSWLKMEKPFARMVCPEPPVPPVDLWENPPKTAAPKIGDLRVTIKPGTHRGVWFWIEKYHEKNLWDRTLCEYVDQIKWYPVDKHMDAGHDNGQVYRWSRDEARATRRATKMINKHHERVAKYEANQSRIKSGTKIYTLNTDR